MQESVFLAILGEEGGSGSLISLLFYLPFILLFLYGQKFQMQMSLFEISGIIKQLEKKIELIDNEIDELVYKLYGITEDERKVIEEENS